MGIKSTSPASELRHRYSCSQSHPSPTCVRGECQVEIFDWLVGGVIGVIVKLRDHLWEAGQLVFHQFLIPRKLKDNNRYYRQTKPDRHLFIPMPYQIHWSNINPGYRDHPQNHI